MRREETVPRAVDIDIRSNRKEHLSLEVSCVVDRKLTITYYLHSGFSVAMEDVLLVFDYWTGEQGELPQDKRITPEFLRTFREVYVFISHEHPDHLDPVVFTWRTEVPITYIVSADMPIGTRGKRMAPGDALTLSPRVQVKAFDSTDLGVSFLVDLAGVKVFHAGDLNFWHWREESTIKEIEEADDAFRQAVEPIAREEIDVAFFPVDARQGMMYDAGANYFMMCVKPRLLIPMHFWGRAEIATEFARRSRCRQTEVLALTRYGEQIGLHFTEDGYIDVSLHTPPEVVVSSKQNTNELPIVEVPDNRDVDLEGYDSADPFADSDLPVKLDE